MFNSNSSPDLRLLIPETVWLEPEHYLLAQQISSLKTNNASTSWQTYINTLALLGLEVWLQDKLITRDISTIKTGDNIKVDQFKFCAIATEHLLDEIVNIPSLVIENPEYTAHFYVLLEVLEEEEEVVIKGFLPHNQLVEVKNNLELPINNGCYQLPLSVFDIEPNHLLFYLYYLQASEIAPLVVHSQVNQVSENLSKIVNATTTKLSQWLQGIIGEGWQTLDSINKPELNLAFSTINIFKDTKKAKIIDLGMNLDNQKVSLLINIFPKKSDDDKDNYAQDQISVLVQLYPMNGDNVLPHNIQLVLLSKAGKVLQETTSRIQDNCIQLNAFKGERGKKFSIKVSLGDSSITENFEL
ncbi:MAG: DUF1822 family protein [Richelia sp. RM2_1_2]|nr:DUF1822 family protein [Richelia sp. SM1_7_0]NJN11174.1 DUF1822 family protein [Richelia sp. RM1_1_1]NJO61884.1 DUF1822 family protein [Richelia sp. RM2_1_2]